MKQPETLQRTSGARWWVDRPDLNRLAATLPGAWALLILPWAALAQPSPPEPRLASKDDYLSCLVATSSIEARKAALAEKDGQLKAKAAKFQEAETDLAAQVKKHPPTTKKEIESYNKAIDSRNASVETLNKASRGLQQELAALNKLIFEANARCGSMLVRPEDAQAAEEEHRARRSPP
jgi:hypothetical protein